LAGDKKCQLKEECKDFVAHLTATDASTDTTDITQLAVFI
jgi:hypothetical protein